MKTERNGTEATLPSFSRSDPLVSHLDGFATFLASEGYAATTAHIKCALVAELGRGLKRRKLALIKLDEPLLGQFHAWRRRRGEVGGMVTTQQLLTFLRSVGCVPFSSPPPTDRSAVGKLMRDFAQFLRSERGLAPATLLNYLPIVRRFLTERFAGTALRLTELNSQDVQHFIVRQAQQVGRPRAKLAVTALRSFLRFLLQRGAIKTNLAAVVPGVPFWRLSGLPKSLPPEQWLGHAHMQTTEMYVRTDPSAKLETLEAVLPPKLRSGRFTATDELIASLNPRIVMRSTKPSNG